MAMAVGMHLQTPHVAEHNRSSVLHPRTPEDGASPQTSSSGVAEQSSQIVEDIDP